ncbi:MAG: hypothetical protein ACFFCZ_23710 [Promethearchaeota archaeon]
MTHEIKTRKSQLEEEGWTRQFTIEEHRVSEYVELYESLGYEVRVEPVVPGEKDECQVCYETECNKYRTIYTRSKQREVKEEL